MIESKLLNYLKLLQIKHFTQISAQDYLNFKPHGEQLALLKHPKIEHKAQQMLEQIRQLGISCVSVECARYPALLKEIYDPPPVLFIRGNVELLNTPQIAIVGARNNSQYGAKVASSFATQLAAHHVTVTSGLALGIDSYAHLGALKCTANPVTIAVLANGLDAIYPRRHSELAAKILEHNGAIISEHPPSVGALRHHFAARNRIITALSLGVIVIEAAAKSGTLISARLALEQNRELFVVPGDIHNPRLEGSYTLLKQGATLMTQLADLFSEIPRLKLVANQEVNNLQLKNIEPDAQKVLECLSYTAIGLESLQAQTRLNRAQLCKILLNLEINGLCSLSGGKYTKT